MKRTEPVQVGAMLDEFFRQRQLRSAVMQGQALELWQSVAGEYVMRYTEDVYIRSGILYVTFSNATVRAEVYTRRRFLAEQINQSLGAKVVRNIIVK